MSKVGGGRNLREGAIGYYIPEDVIANILKEHPVKYLLRFRCVSKHWRSIIDQPSFVDMHHRRSYDRPGGVKLLVEEADVAQRRWQNFVLMDLAGEEEEGYGGITPVSHPMPGYFVKFFHTLEGVGGLVLIFDTVWNPTIRKAFRLPRQRIIANLEFEIGRDAVTVKNVHFLGFNSTTKQYKVLSICWVSGDQVVVSKGNYHFQIFTLGGAGCCWRDITQSCVREKEIKGMEAPKMSIYVKDKIYFLVKYPGLQYSALMAFSVEEENFRFLRLPDCIDADSWGMFETQGRVAFVRRRNLVSSHIWILMDFNAVRWEVIGPQTWPAFPRKVFVCDMGNNEILVESNRKLSGEADDYVALASYYVDITNMNIRTGPPNLERTRATKIVSKVVETLFDPNPR